MKYLFVLTLVACFAFPTVSQTPSGSSADSKCSLTREQAPEIRGIRLGMSTEQLLTLFPEDFNRERITDGVKASKNMESYGLGRFHLLPDNAANPKLAGINSITVVMIDERVTSVTVDYGGVEWKTIDQFVAKLSDGLRLPSSSWERGDQSGHWNCNGFSVEARFSRGTTQSWVTVRDTSTPRVIEDRREAAKEKAREAFKP